MGSCLAEKQWECEFDHTSSSSAEFKNKWSCTSAPPIYLHGADRDNSTFFNFCGRILLLYLRKEEEIEEDIAFCLLLYTVCQQCARSCLTCGTASLNNFRIHEFLSFALLIAVTPWIPSLRLWNMNGVLTSPVSDCWQALLYRWFWIPVPGSNRMWDGGLGEQDLVSCQASSQPAIAPLWWHSKGEVMWGVTFLQNYARKTQHRHWQTYQPINQPIKQPSPWSRALFKNLIVPELIKNLSMFCGMEIFISCVYNSPPLIFVMNQINSFHILPSCFFNLYLTGFIFGVRIHPTEFPFKSLHVSDNMRFVSCEPSVMK